MAPSSALVLDFNSRFIILTKSNRTQVYWLCLDLGFVEQVVERSKGKISGMFEYLFSHLFLLPRQTKFLTQPSW